MRLLWLYNFKAQRYKDPTAQRYNNLTLYQTIEPLRRLSEFRARYGSHPLSLLPEGKVVELINQGEFMSAAG